MSLVLVGCALSLGYLAAAWLCEGARLDADDPRRSAQLPFRYESLAWWHAAVPCLVLLAAVGVPAAVAGLVSGDLRPLILLVVTIPVLVGGALVNVFRGSFSPALFVGADTPVGNTAALSIVFWYAWGTVLAVLPMTVVVSSALGSPGSGPLVRALVIGPSRGRAWCLRGPPRGAAAGRLTGPRLTRRRSLASISCLVRLSPTGVGTENRRHREQRPVTGRPPRRARARR